MSETKTRLDANVHISADRIKELLQRPSFFGYHGNEEMFETWSIGPTILSRDSNLIERANYQALINHLESDPSLAEDYDIERARHWACGWVEHLTFKVLEDVDEAQIQYHRDQIDTVDRHWTALLVDYGEVPPEQEADFQKQIREHEAAIRELRESKVTRIARVVEDWFSSLQDYGIADDELYSQMEYEAALEGIEEIVNMEHELKDGVEVCAEDVYNMIHERNGYVALDNDGWPANWDDVKYACQDLGYLEEGHNAEEW